MNPETGRPGEPDPAHRSASEQKLRHGAVDGDHDVADPGDNAEPVPGHADDGDELDEAAVAHPEDDRTADP